MRYQSIVAAVVVGCLCTPATAEDKPALDLDIETAVTAGGAIG